MLSIADGKLGHREDKIFLCLLYLSSALSAKANSSKSAVNCYSASVNKIMIRAHLRENSLTKNKSKACSSSKYNIELLYKVHKVYKGLFKNKKKFLN